jgi:dTDP-4-amino-4,6-dideoxygalactose transaminase
MPAYRKFGYARDSLPHTEQACLDVVSLPMFPELRDDEVQYIIECCNEFPT